jgi:signal transduction histidine kinase
MRSRIAAGYLAVVSHELRNPLHPILTVASVLESDNRLPDDVRDDVRMIARNARVQLRLVDDLLDLHRIARGKLALVLDTVDAHELAEEVVAMCRTDAGAKGVALEARLAARRHHLRADAGRLRQVLWNLVRNAVKFTPAGGRIVVTTGNSADGCLCLDVSDTGVGIEPAALGRVFEAFEQWDRAAGSRGGGLGLGLAIARSLVVAHGGTLSASSPGIGHGATFRVTLPTVEPQAVPSSTRVAREAGRPAAMRLAAK